MKPEKRDLLRHVADFIEFALREKPPHEVIRAVEEAHGAKCGFRCGTYELRMLGVVGTSTMGQGEELKSWVRAARRKLEKEA